MEGFGNMDIMGMMQKAQEQARRMAEDMEKKLGETVVEGSAGGGMVSIKLAANLKVKDINIEPEVINKDDKEMLEDLIVAALNHALKQANEAREKAQQGQMGNLGAGLGGLPGLDGVDLSKIFGG